MFMIMGIINKQCALNLLYTQKMNPKVDVETSRLLKSNVVL